MTAVVIQPGAALAPDGRSSASLMRDSSTPGVDALGLSRCANGVCIVEIRRDLYPACVTHEIRHVFEGDWHAGRETVEGC